MYTLYPTSPVALFVVLCHTVLCWLCAFATICSQRRSTVPRNIRTHRSGFQFSLGISTEKACPYQRYTQIIINIITARQITILLYSEDTYKSGITLHFVFGNSQLYPWWKQFSTFDLSLMLGMIIYLYNTLTIAAAAGCELVDWLFLGQTPCAAKSKSGNRRSQLPPRGTWGAVMG